MENECKLDNSWRPKSQTVFYEAYKNKAMLVTGYGTWLTKFSWSIIDHGIHEFEVLSII